MTIDIKKIWAEHKLWIIGLVVAFILGGMLCQTASAQECTPATGDGPVAQKKSAVKKLSDQVTIKWTPPTFLADCTPISDDPSYAITGYVVYISLDAPASTDLTGVNLPATQTELVVRVDTTTGVKPGSRLYYAIQSTNEYGSSFLSNQEWVQVGGPPGRSTTSVQ